MAKSDAERARDYRKRKREQRGIVPMMPVADHEAFKAKARTLLEEQQARIATLEERADELTEQARGRQAPPCPACGGALACPRCYRGDSYLD